MECKLTVGESEKHELIYKKEPDPASVVSWRVFGALSPIGNIRT